MGGSLVYTMTVGVVGPTSFPVLEDGIVESGSTFMGR